MEKIASQLCEYSNICEKTIPTVPTGCIPLLGYTKKKSSLLEIKNDNRNFLNERKVALETWRKNDRAKIQLRKTGIARMQDHPNEHIQENYVVCSEDERIRYGDLTLSKYFAFERKLLECDKDKVKYKSHTKKNYNFIF